MAEGSRGGLFYRLIIVAATVIWGSSFVIVKDVTDYLTPAWLLAIRFFIAAVILAAVFLNRKEFYFERSHVLCGALFGTALFIAYYVQTWGITFTTPGKNAFLTGTYCVLVPFFAWFATRKSPTKFNLLAAVICLIGIGFVSLSGDLSVNIGDALTLLCAVFYAIHIVLVSRFSEGRDIMVLTMWQFAFAGLWALAVGLVAEPLPVALAGLSLPQFAQLGYLAVICTALALLFQNMGQAKIPPAQASLLLSLESPFGVAFSVALGAEILTGKILFGFALIFFAIVISEVFPTLFEKE